MCVCVRACVRACVRVCVCVHVHVCEIVMKFKLLLFYIYSCWLPLKDGLVYAFIGPMIAILIVSVFIFFVDKSTMYLILDSVKISNYI